MARKSRTTKKKASGSGRRKRARASRKGSVHPFDRRPKPRVDLRLAYGTIAEVDAEAVVVGLFEGAELSRAAQAIDERMDGAMTEIRQRRMFVGRVGEVFILPSARHDLRADVVVCAGMGSFEDFGPDVLRIVAENVARTLVRARVNDFATVLFGASRGRLYGGLAHLVDGFLTGVRGSRARNPLRAITVCETNRLRCEEIERAIVKLYGTRRAAAIEVALEKVTLPDPPSASASSPRSSIVLQATRVSDPNDADTVLRFSVLGAGDKAAILSDTVTLPESELAELVAEVDDEAFIHAHSTAALKRYGTRLGRAVVPKKIASVLKDAVDGRRILLLQDGCASRIPWETLCLDGWFPAATCGMSRQYIADSMPVARWLEHRRFDETVDVLLIVNPTGDLDGAEREGEIVEAAARGIDGIRIKRLRGRGASRARVKKELESGQYDVLHYAGHTAFYPDEPEKTGIVCAGHRVLTGAELRSITNLPALAFFNSCESARIGGLTQRGARGLARNVGLAEALLRGGVANYLGTHWQVADDAAPAFMEAFYGALLDSETMGSAVFRGRKAVKKLRSRDWADYVHYGSPTFVLKVPHGESGR